MNAQIQQWLELKWMPDKVSIELGIGQNLHNLFDYDLYPIWLRFAQVYEELMSTKQTTELEWLKELFQTENDLLEVLTSPSNVRNTKGEALLTQFMNEQKDPVRAFDMFMHSRSGLRAFFTQNNKKLSKDLQQKMMRLTDPSSRMTQNSLAEWREFKQNIDLPESKNVLSMLETHDIIRQSWIFYIKSMIPEMPTKSPVTETIEVLASTDMRSLKEFVNIWREHSVDPSDVYTIVLEFQNAKASQVVWKLFINDYMKTKKLNIPPMIKTFKSLSAQHSSKSDNYGEMRKIVNEWVNSEFPPKQAFEALLLDVDASRLLNHWFVCMDHSFRNLISKPGFESTASMLRISSKNPSAHRAYLKMLSMFILFRDLGDLQSRNIVNLEETMWILNPMPFDEIIWLLQLDTTTNELIAKAEKMLIARNEVDTKTKAEEGARKYRHSSSLGVGSAQHGQTLKSDLSGRDEEIVTVLDKALSHLLNNPLLPFYFDLERKLNRKGTLFGTLLHVLKEKKLTDVVEAAEESIAIKIICLQLLEQDERDVPVKPNLEAKTAIPTKTGFPPSRKYHTGSPK
ncbi:uncharacterized protein PHALS_04245 [Plasmopara halstedii]|uniref:Uncharacterized protein n=1 Tax=Plasmopara halstedii TaxID=4781 RepID=A0A0N7L7K9_PLAHL|nr:uncharacterized protein PHALS_04245 [Plasmopara halstedii]CEG47363.1 hypothetical protein PHALS_04245 [Plasmopara halstedii]|eukprot:XP_024583732.1 hypothetical protein PHALS_04245 [Plasmopara halstedii]